MKTKILIALAISALIVATQHSVAGPSDATTNVLEGQLHVINKNIVAKFQAGAKTSVALTNEFAAFDTLLGTYKNGTIDDQAEIVLDEATIYEMLLHDIDRSVPLYERLLQNYPTSKSAVLYQQLTEKTQAKGLPNGTPFPDFAEKDIHGQPISVANYKGKIVLIDFWATWCGPCKAELPNVLDTYQKHHDQGFEVIGVSLDSDQSKLTNFLSANQIPWPQYFDGMAWTNKLALKYGIKAIPATFLIDGEGKLLGKNLRGARLQMAVIEALKNRR